MFCKLILYYAIRKNKGRKTMRQNQLGKFNENVILFGQSLGGNLHEYFIITAKDDLPFKPSSA